jgi:hypothetical protein
MKTRTSYHQRKIINRSKPRQDLKGLIPDTIEEENGDYEFKAKRLGDQRATKHFNENFKGSVCANQFF